MIIYTEISKSELHKIKSLWEGLNQVHLEDSIYFTGHYHHFTFEKRSARWKQLPEDEIYILVAHHENSEIGYCVSTIGPANEGEIDSLYVNPEFRGLNIGRVLMERSMLWLHHNKCKPIRLAVSYGHESVFGFYEKLGFYPRMTVMEWKQ